MGLAAADCCLPAILAAIRIATIIARRDQSPDHHAENHERDRNHRAKRLEAPRPAGPP